MSFALTMHFHSELLSDVFGLLSGIPTDRDLIKDPTRVERGAHA